MKFLKKLFGKREDEKVEEKVVEEIEEALEEEVELGDDPLDPHGDGTIRKGDPMYDLMMGLMSGEGDTAIIANRNEKGKWNIERF